MLLQVLFILLSEVVITPDVNAGRVFVELDIETANLNTRVDEVVNAVNRAADGTSKASTGLTQKMITGVTQYQQKLDIIAAKLERQRQIIKNLQAETTKPLTASKLTAAEAQLEKENIKLKELEAQFDRTYNSMTSFIQGQDKIAQKAATSTRSISNITEKADLRTVGANFKMGTDMMASGLRTINEIAPGVAGNIGNIITQLNLARADMLSTGNTALKWAMGISAAVGIVATLAVGVYKQVKKEEEKRQQLFKDGLQNIQDYTDSLRTLESSYKVLNDGKSSMDEINNARKELTDSFDDLITGYDREGQAILANNDAIAQKIQLTQQQIELEKESILLNGESSYNDYQNTLDKIESTKQKIKDMEDQLRERESQYGTEKDNSFVADTEYIAWAADQEKAIKNLRQNITEYNDALKENEEEVKEYVEIAVEANLKVKDATTGVMLSLNQLNEEQQAVAEAIQEKYVNSVMSGALKIEEAQARIQEAFADPDTYARYAEQVNAAINAVNQLDISSELEQISQLNTAYQSLSDGKALDVSRTYELVNAYPELMSYISQTGDLTFANGEIIKQLAETKRQEAIASKQADIEKLEATRQATVNTINLLMQQANAYKILAAAKGQSIEGPLTANDEMDLVKYKTAQNELKKITSQLDQATAQLEILKNSAASVSNISTGSGSKSSGSSSKSNRNEALAAELKQLDQKKKMDQLTYQEELDWLERIQQKYKMNADEKADLEYRIYSVKKQLEEELEKANSERLQAEYDAIEHKKKLNELSAKEELAWLEKIQQTFVMNKDEQMELEIKLYNLRKELREDDIDSLNTLGDAVTEALKNKYKEQQEAEENRINDSIESWKKWEDDTVEAIQGQIDALDELEKQQDREEERAEYERKRQATALQLAYEKDEYNRKQLQKELAKLDKEEQERLDEIAREDLKEQLEAQIDATKEESQKHQDALEEELDKVKDKYEELMSDFNLRAEAEKAIMESTQQQIIAMIKSYAPEYDLAGQTIGQKLVDGFKSKVGDIESYIQGIIDNIASYQANMAALANDAADNFWRKKAEYDAYIAAQAAPAVSQPAAAPQVNMTVQFNQPIQSPVDVRRAMDKVANDIARRIGG